MKTTWIHAKVVMETINKFVIRVYMYKGGNIILLFFSFLYFVSKS